MLTMLQPFHLRTAALVSLVSAAVASAQIPATNPPTVIKQRVSATEIELAYNRPSVKGRQIFGALVKYNQVWRTGSDSATKLSFSTPVSLNGTPLGAGDYELFTIPTEKDWTVIIHKNMSQWGSYSYDARNDVARVTVTPEQLPTPVESFTIAIGDLRPTSAMLYIDWDRVRVPLRIDIDAKATAVPKVEAALQAEGRKPYFTAAMFYFETELDLNRAAELMALALESQPNHIGMLHRQALILAKKRRHCGSDRRRGKVAGRSSKGRTRVEGRVHQAQYGLAAEAPEVGGSGREVEGSRAASRVVKSEDSSGLAPTHEHEPLDRSDRRRAAPGQGNAAEREFFAAPGAPCQFRVDAEGVPRDRAEGDVGPSAGQQADRA